MITIGARPIEYWLKRLIFPTIWCTGGQIILILSSLGASRINVDKDIYDAYYIISRQHYILILPSAFVIFSAIYAFINICLSVQVRPLLGWAHFALMLLGASLIVAPSLFLRLKSMPSRYDDPETTFILCNRVSTVGYLMTLVSVLVFVALIADSLTRFFRQRRRSGID